MYRLEAHGAIPHTLEPALRLLRALLGRAAAAAAAALPSSAPLLAAVDRPEGRGAGEGLAGGEGGGGRVEEGAGCPGEGCCGRMHLPRERESRDGGEGGGGEMKCSASLLRREGEKKRTKEWRWRR